MTIPTNDDILGLLDFLETATADDLENQWLDFKPWQGPKDDMKIAVEYAACLANAEGGVVVFGVADRTRGRAKAIHGASGYDVDVWRRGIFDSTRPNLTVEVEELRVPEGTGRVLVVRVPRGKHPPYGTAQGLFKQRVGKNCMPMDAQSFFRSQVAIGAIDWSAERARDLTPADLDPIEIARARNVLRKNREDSGLLALNDQDLLRALGAVRNGQVTYAGLLLFGREEKLQELCPQHQVHYVYQVTGTEVARNDSYQAGLLNILERIEQTFTSPMNPEQELPLGLFRMRIPAFPVEVVREAVLNAVTHRNYLDPGEVLVRHTADRLVITSPGGFIDGITPWNILRHEPASRNRALAHAFEKLRLVERSGIGRRRIFETMLSYGKRIPEYEADSRVTLRIFDGSFDEQMAALVARWRGEGREIGLDGLLVLSFLRDNTFIDTFSAAKLLQLSREEARSTLDRLSQPKTGFLERKGGTKAATFHLTKGVAKDLLGKAAYTKTRGLNPLRYAEMVRAYVEHHGSIAPRECRELLGLGDSDSARVEMSKYLRIWSSEGGFLRREGTKGPKVRYRFP
ncbi:MAG TPA: RNA-binding domain-containing protein [Thermoanaerobaculia bacterium]|nr:RNA-binding domain-containing protein [Thermoanaerobaculia bacterium]